MRKKKSIHFLFVIIAVVAMLALALSMHHGPGIGGDATIYLFSARNLLDGRGLGLLGPQGEFRLIPYFPPFYSLLLAGIALPGLDMVGSSWWLNLFLFGALVWLVGALTYRVCHSLSVAALSALLVSSSPVLIPVYSWAMSEPLAILLGFAGLTLLLITLIQPQRKCLFYASAVATGLSFLTRYNSIAFIATACLALLFFLRKPMRLRLWDTAVYFLVAFFPMLIWLFYDFSYTSTVASRSFVTASEMAARLASFFSQLKDVLLFWVIPDSWISSPPYPLWINPVIVILMVLVLTAWLAWYAYIEIRNHHIPEHQPSVVLAALLAIFSLVYLFINTLVYITTFPPITIASRMLSPLHVSVLWLVGVMASFTLLRFKDKRLKSALLIFSVITLAWYGWRSVRIISQNYETGLGFLSPAWQRSPTIQAINELPADTLIVTNEQTAVLFLTNRLSYPLAEIFLNAPLDRFTRYGDGGVSTDAGETSFRNHAAALVLFDTTYDQFETLYRERTQQRVKVLVEGLHQAFRGDDGAIYYYPSQ